MVYVALVFECLQNPERVRLREPGACGDIAQRRGLAHPGEGLQYVEPAQRGGGHDEIVLADFAS